MARRMSEAAEQVFPGEVRCMPPSVSTVRLVQLDEGEVGNPVDGDQEMKPALRGLDLGDVDVDVAERVGLELAFASGGPLHVGQPGDAMPLQAAVRR